MVENGFIFGTKWVFFWFAHAVPHVEHLCKVCKALMPYIMRSVWGGSITWGRGREGLCLISISRLEVGEVMQGHGTTCDCSVSDFCTLLFVSVLQGNMGDRQLKQGMKGHSTGLDANLQMWLGAWGVGWGFRSGSGSR